jgi:hypothetical protein
MAVVISRYLAYYTGEIPKKLQELVFDDHNMLLVKDGLCDIKGYKCPRLSLQVFSINSRVDGQRITGLNTLLNSLIKAGTLEHFVKV